MPAAHAIPMISSSSTLTSSLQSEKLYRNLRRLPRNFLVPHIPLHLHNLSHHKPRQTRLILPLAPWPRHIPRKQIRRIRLHHHLLQRYMSYHLCIKPPLSLITNHPCQSDIHARFEQLLEVLDGGVGVAVGDGFDVGEKW